MGRPQFVTPRTGGTERLASSDRPEYTALTETQTGDVLSGNTESVTVTAPTGSIYRLRALRHRVAGIAGATGDHKLVTKPLNHVVALDGQSAGTGEINLQGLVWRTADTPHPATEDAQATSLKGLAATDTSGILFRYANNTDSTQTGDRTILAVMREDSY